MNKDAELKSNVLAALDWKQGIDEEDIGVTVHNGIVTLSGHIASYSQKWAAVDATGDVRGVRGIVDEINVHLQGSSLSTDEEIARATADAFRWNPYIPESKIKIRVHDGEVTVDGIVDAHYQRNAVATTLLRITGIRAVNNLIELTPQTTPSEIAGKIKDAFVRHARLDAERIEVETLKGTVILRGEVSSWAERRDAEEAAWASPGISWVENHIEVLPI